MAKTTSTDSKSNLIKSISIIFFVLGTLSFISTFVVFHNTWTLVSTPTVMFVFLVLTIINLYFVYIEKTNISAWFIIIMIVFGSIGMIYNDGYTYYAVPYMLTLVILLSMAFLPRNSIIILTVISVILIFIIANIQYPALVKEFPNEYITTPIENLTRNLVALMEAIIAWMIMGQNKNK